MKNKTNNIENNVLDIVKFNNCFKNSMRINVFRNIWNNVKQNVQINVLFNVKNYVHIDIQYNIKNKTISKSIQSNVLKVLYD